MALASWRLKGSEDVLFAEAFALYRSTDLAIDCGFRRVVFEVDSEKLVKLVQNDMYEDRSYLGQLIYEIRILQSQFDACSIIHIDRSCNGLAHKMAQIAHSNTVYIQEIVH